MFFNKRKDIKPKHDKFKDEYSKLIGEVEYLDNMFEPYITNSLKSEFDIFKKNIDVLPIYTNSPSSVINHNWILRSYNLNSLILKKHKDWNSISLFVQYNFCETNYDLTIKNISLLDSTISLKQTNELYEIVSNYIKYTKIKIEEHRKVISKDKLKEVINVIGENVIRDEKINNILN